MTDNNINDNLLMNVITYVFMFLIILQAGSVYLYQDDIIGSAIKPLCQICLIILFLFSLLKVYRHFNYRLLIFYIIFILLTFMLLILEYLNFKFSLHIFILMIFDPIMLMTCFYYSYYEGDSKSLFYKFENIMLILAFISILFWLLALIGVKTNMNTSVNWATNTDFSKPTENISGYFDLDFLAQGKVAFFGFSNVIRNTGIFNEAPIYSSLLVIALFIELFFRNIRKVFNYRSILLIITIISTTSTNGVFLLVLALLLEYFSLTNKKIMLQKKNKIFLSFIFLLLFVVSALILKSLLFYKTDYSLGSSYSVRMNDFLVAFNEWKCHPILGVGLYNNNPLIQDMPLWRLLIKNVDLSTGFMRILAWGGSLLGLYYIIPMISVLHRDRNIAFFVILVFILLVVEGIDTFYIFNIIISYFWFNILINSEMKQNFSIKNEKSIFSLK